MANYHLEAIIISRGKGRSFTSSVSYAVGRTLHDAHQGKPHYEYRDDVVWQRVFLPDNAPPAFRDLQVLCNAVERAEARWDARTAREFIGSLPNELPPGELIRIVRSFIETNFVSNGLCAIAAIHKGRNKDTPSKNNPHVHIIVPTRAIGPDGFDKKKDREHDKKKYINIWREQWAEVQNRAYERNGLDVRVSHESLEVQGERNREPTIHLSRIDWQREQRGERTATGDKKRKIQERNKERNYQRDLEQELELERLR